MSQFTKGGGSARLPLYTAGYVIGSKKEAPSANLFLTADLTFAGFINTFKDGSTGVLVVTQDSLGGHSVNWNGQLTFIGASTINLAASSKTIIDVIKSGTVWYGNIRGLGTNSGGSGLPNGGTAGQFLRKASSTDGDAGWAPVTKADVGLPLVDNTADSAKPVSGPQQTAMNALAPKNNPIFTGKLETPTSTTLTAGFRLTPGFLPTTFVEGDMYIYNDGLRLFYGGSSILLGAKSHVAIQDFQLAASDMETPLESTTRAAYNRVTRAGKVIGVRASLNIASTSGSVSVDIKKNGTSILSTPLTIDATELTSQTALVAAGLTGGFATVAADDEISVDIIDGGVDAAGLIVSLIYEQAANPVTGLDKQVIFNDGGTDMGAASQMTWNKATNTLTVTNLAVTGAVTGVGGMANPMTTAGDVIVGGAAGAPARLPVGTNGQFMTVASGTPAWATITKTTVGLNLVDNTADTAKVVASAAKWTTARNFTFTGDATGSATGVDGTANVSIALTMPDLLTAVTDARRVTVNAKGQVTAASKPTLVPAGIYQQVQVNEYGEVIDGSNPTTLEGYGITNGLSNPLTAVGDILIGGTVTGGSAATARLPIGTTGQILRVSGGNPQWWTANYLVNPITTEGDIVIGGAAGATARFGIGAANQILTSTGTTLAWTTSLSLAQGGTGGTDAATARTALGVQPTNNPTFTGTVSGISKAMVGLGSVNNTADVEKEVLSATKLKTARNIALTGAVTGTVSFDGTADATIATTKAPFAWTAFIADHTLVLADAANGVAMDMATGNNLTVPPFSDVAFAIGDKITITQDGAGLTTIVPGVGVTVRRRGAGALASAGQFAVFYLIKRDTNVWLLTGDLA